MKTNEYIIIHHSAVSRNKNSEQFDAINGYHKRKGWGQIGYHFLIEPSGKVKKGRPVTMVGAHCSQKLMNYRSIGICLAGHFDIEDPTEEQKKALSKLLKELQSTYGVLDNKIRLHREYATYKSCPGNRIPNDILTYVKEAEIIPDWAKDGVKWAKKTKISNCKNLNEPVTRMEMIVMLHRLSKQK